MATLLEIEQKTKEYASHRALLSMLVAELHEELTKCRSQALPAIKAAVATAANCHADLKAMLDESRALFEKPKTRIFNLIKVGYAKQRGEVIIEDEAVTVARIEKLLPKEQAELLIKVKKTVLKSAVADLSAGDLKRLSITVHDTGDVVLIKPVDSEIDKLVAALLDEAEKVEEAA